MASSWRDLFGGNSGPSGSDPKVKPDIARSAIRRLQGRVHDFFYPGEDKPEPLKAEQKPAPVVDARPKTVVRPAAQDKQDNIEGKGVPIPDGGGAVTIPVPPPQRIEETQTAPSVPPPQGGGAAKDKTSAVTPRGPHVEASVGLASAHGTLAQAAGVGHLGPDAIAKNASTFNDHKGALKGTFTDHAAKTAAAESPKTRVGIDADTRARALAQVRELETRQEMFAQTDFVEDHPKKESGTQTTVAHEPNGLPSTFSI